jgi:hypothetical protein
VQEVKWAMLAAQVAALVAWIYLRRCAPAPLERFGLDNMYLTGHLLVVVGLLGPAVLRMHVAIVFCAVAAAVGYNFARYLREFRSYAYLPHEARENQPTTASRINQVLIAVACWMGAVVLMGMTLLVKEREFSHLTFLTMLPGLTGALVAPSEAYHRRLRARGLA